MPYKYNDNSRTDELVKKMIPVLVRWAQASWDSNHYYSDLQHAIGAKTPRLGHQLGCLSDELNNVAQKLGYHHIPTLNALVLRESTKLPSAGFDYVDKSYSSLSAEAKRAYVKAKNREAHEFDWAPILDALGLKPATLFTSQELSQLRKSSQHAGSGEGEAHKHLKQYVAEHPELIGIQEACKVETEHYLLSGDRIDVYFETEEEIFGVEVKSHISSEEDIVRGIFQCVKYQAVLEKEQLFEEHGKRINTLLVMENKLTARCQQIVADLAINVVDDFQLVD